MDLAGNLLNPFLFTGKFILKNILHWYEMFTGILHRFQITWIVDFT